MSRIIKCSDCGTILQYNEEEHTPCQNCGSVNRTLVIGVSDEIQTHEKVGLKAKKDGIKKPIREVVSGDDFFRTENKWVKKERVIDRENNSYHEKVIDVRTGEVIHECDEPLTEHYGHGSAKKIP